MGTLTYDGTVIEFDDRTLTHLEIVIVQRFRTGNGVLLSWVIPSPWVAAAAASGSRRTPPCSSSSRGPACRRSIASGSWS
ncbi:hypothetical protein [Amnibacterium sp.]|uniref:DUF7882 family protein n=1 Tax=Amnibacterium sp. TaxID=1872496 RepID=UPI00260532DB|nr:hypothetical protein [Amnibacterium sp.]